MVYWFKLLWDTIKKCYYVLKVYLVVCYKHSREIFCCQYEPCHWSGIMEVSWHLFKCIGCSTNCTYLWFTDIMVSRHGEEDCWASGLQICCESISSLNFWTHNVLGNMTFCRIWNLEHDCIISPFSLLNFMMKLKV